MLVIRSVFLVGTMILGVGVASSQVYPDRPIRVVAAPPGGGIDFATRLIASGISEGLGQQVIVDNRGGPIDIRAQIVARAPPDGYTLNFSSSTLWLAPFLNDKTSYDPVKDFSPISLASRSPNVLLVHPSVAAHSVKELIALATAKPGALNYAMGSPGASNHLAAELFKFMAGINIMGIPYKGSGPALTDLLAGQVQLMFATAASGAPHIKSGRLRALAVTSGQPSSLLPGLPTIAASGLPGFESATSNGMFAPAKTPITIIDRLNTEMVRFLSRADVKEKFFIAGVEAVGSSPQEFAAAIRAEMTRMGTVIRKAGIRAD